MEELILRLQQPALLLSFLLLQPVQLSPGDLVRVHGLPAAGGGVRVVRWSPGTFLCVLFFPPFGPAILKPYLQRQGDIALVSRRQLKPQI